MKIISARRKKAIMLEAILKFGNDQQIDMAIEEAGELITALAKRNRTFNGSTKRDIIEEMADMQIMIWQLMLIFGVKNKAFNETITSKFEKLDSYLNESFKENQNA